MTICPAPLPTSFEELYASLSNLPPNVTGEILGGRVIVTPRPAPPHTVAEGGIQGDLRAQFGRPPGGSSPPGEWRILVEPEIRFGDVLFVPDVAGWRRERLPKVPRKGPLTVIPDWVCEIVSPSSERMDRNEKARVYREHKVPYRWLVAPLLRTVEAYRLEGVFWVQVGVWSGDERARIEPFDAVELDLAGWWEGVEEEEG